MELLPHIILTSDEAYIIDAIGQAIEAQRFFNSSFFICGMEMPQSIEDVRYLIRVDRVLSNLSNEVVYSIIKYECQKQHSRESLNDTVACLCISDDYLMSDDIGTDIVTDPEVIETDRVDIMEMIEEILS